MIDHICAACGVEISQARLRALPDATTCIACADDTRVVGLAVWDHKTAPSIEIGTQLAQDSAGRRHTRFGPHIQFNAMEGKYGCARGAEDERTMRELAERLGRERRGEPEPEETLGEALITPDKASRCHPARLRIGPSGLCLECALAKQAARLR
jgi:hypothetical protein